MFKTKKEFIDFLNKIRASIRAPLVKEMKEIRRKKELLERCTSELHSKCTRPSDRECHAHNGIYCMNAFLCPPEEDIKEV